MNAGLGTVLAIRPAFRQYEDSGLVRRDHVTSRRRAAITHHRKVASLDRGELRRRFSGSGRPPRLVDRLSASDDAETDPELHLVVREQIDSVLHALPTLTDSERAAMSGGLNDQTNGQVAQALHVTPKAAAQAAYRARRKLASRLSRAA
jgi:DNA-directed RNA polymerase specialized sigma24 family protein